ncbi:MAG: cyclic nucleotide-binding domain-containing protein, partial [Nitrospinae bacterium]|nr:cyclic nucleotide-binding domain-containing protein [Nitrospinota bacterium]
MIKHFGKGEIILREGDPSRCAYILDEGQVEVLKKQGNHRDIHLAILGKGELFGEMGLIDDAPRSATIRTLSACTVTILTGEDYEILLQNNSQALMQILKVYRNRLRSTLQ